MRLPFELWELSVHQLLACEDAIHCTANDGALRAWHRAGISAKRVAGALNRRYASGWLERKKKSAARVSPDTA